MKVENTKIEDVKIIEPDVFGDDRGYFFESWNEEKFINEVAFASFVQDNHSCSKKNILRGLHYQLNNPQGKLVRVTRGEVFDVAVDLRKSSPTFKQWVGVLLSESNKKQLWIPEGFAHGFLVLSDIAEFQYKCTNFYDPDSEVSLYWNDPELNIDWPLEEEPILSSKDSSAARLDLEKVFA